MPDTGNVLDRLENLRLKLEAEGWYVKANTAALAITEINTLSEVVKITELYFREETLCRPLTPAEAALAKAARAVLSIPETR